MRGSSYTTQRGFIDFGPALRAFATVAAIAGFALALFLIYVVPWLWSLVKPLVHTWTA